MNSLATRSESTDYQVFVDSNLAYLIMGKPSKVIRFIYDLFRHTNRNYDISSVTIRLTSKK